MKGRCSRRNGGKVDKLNLTNGYVRANNGDKAILSPKKLAPVGGKKAQARLDKPVRGALDADAYKDGGWIKNAIKHPGEERKAAKRAGLSTHQYMEDHKGDKGKSGSRARLGLTLEKMHDK